MDALNKLIISPGYKELFAILKGFRNGAVYGAKIRFPHALVMTFLFRRTNLKDMLRIILKLTYQHSRNLAVFVTIYKTLLYLQRKVKGFEHHSDSFLAGIVGGYIVFGTDTGVNNQIVLYLFSRIMVGLASVAVKKGIIPKPEHSFSAFAAVTWGIVMWLFRHHRDSLQGSLQASMQYLYNDSDVFDGIETLLLKNKAE